MAIPDYFQEINEPFLRQGMFSSPNTHPRQANFIAEGLTEINPLSGDLSWNAAGRAVLNQIISKRFLLAVELYDFIRSLEARLPNSQVSRQLVARGYYAMFSAGRAVSLTLCARDWGMGKGNHGNLPTHLERHTRADSWYPHFQRHLIRWRALRNCADYDLFTILVYSGRYAGRRPPKVDPRYTNLNDAAMDVGNKAEEYLRQSQRLITSKGVHLVRTI